MSSDAKEDVKPERRKRDLLKSWYMAEASLDNNNDPTDIDSPAFDATKHFEHLLKTCSLQDLIAKDNEMVTKIKTLDGDMKTLVYENYNKFISATDTIRKMKSNVESMEEEMARLSKNMETITNCSDKIDSVLAPRRDKIEQLSGIHRLLQKLQFLVTLPGRLQRCVDMESYAQAVKYFTFTSGILKQCSHIPSFGHIYGECTKIMDTVRDRLRKKMTVQSNSPSAIADVVDAADLLLELKDPVDQIRITFLTGRRIHLETVLQTFESRDPNVSLDAEKEKDAEPPLVSFIKDFDAQFFGTLVYIVQSYRSLFISRFDDNNKDESQKIIEEFSKETMSKFLSIVKIKLAQGKQPKDKVKGLEALYNDVARIYSQLPGSDTGGDRIADVVQSTVHHQIEAYFTSLQEIISKHITLMSQTQPPNDNSTPNFNPNTELAERTAQAILSEIQVLFENLKPFFERTESKFLAKHYSIIFIKIQVKLQGFFLFLTEYLDVSNPASQTPGQTADLKVTPRVLLLLVSVCLYLESRGLSHVMQQMQDLVNHVRLAIQGAGDKAKNSIDLNSVSFNAPDLAKRLKDSAQNLVWAYVQMQGKSVGFMFRQGIDTQPSWLKMKEPQSVRLVVGVVVQEVIKMGKEVDSILGGSSLTSSSGSSSATVPRAQTRNSSSSAANLLLADIKKTSSAPSLNSSLFDKKVVVFARPADFSPSTLMASIIKIGLKTLAECIRLRTFGRNGYQQLQVDLHYLQLSLPKVLGTHQPQLDSLIDDCEKSCQERCIDPVPMEPLIIAKLCEAKMDKK
eukprot:TRINITY_DN3309_c0_g1_i1.p1 TRINITY_DN3309_c0_g1~~TRINITY_DN3309_c0_g1_i1.p1  ORF type:complete len:795 (-),score=178.23 TRINITY_DN3309_c0_g1_i1:42-2426(-)